eukprot:scaffold38714_cov27-Tisochrysis_lutea.AAC.1
MAERPPLHPGGEREFLIKWRGWPNEQATWEPLSSLDGCHRLLRAFCKSGGRMKPERAVAAQPIATAAEGREQATEAKKGGAEARVVGAAGTRAEAAAGAAEAEAARPAEGRGTSTGGRTSEQSPASGRQAQSVPKPRADGTASEWQRADEQRRGPGRPRGGAAANAGAQPLTSEGTDQ